MGGVRMVEEGVVRCVNDKGRERESETERQRERTSIRHLSGEQPLQLCSLSDPEAVSSFSTILYF